MEQRSLHDRLGAKEAVVAVVDVFVGRAASDGYHAAPPLARV